MEQNTNYTAATAVPNSHPVTAGTQTLRGRRRVTSKRHGASLQRAGLLSLPGAAAVLHASSKGVHSKVSSSNACFAQRGCLVQMCVSYSRVISILLFTDLAAVVGCSCAASACRAAIHLGHPFVYRCCEIQRPPHHGGQGLRQVEGEFLFLVITFFPCPRGPPPAF